MTLIATARTPVQTLHDVGPSLYHSTTCSNARCAVSLGSHVALQGPQMGLESKGPILCCTSAVSPQNAVGRRT